MLELPRGNFLPLHISFYLGDILRAEAWLRHLTARLASCVQGEPTVSEASFTKLVERYIANPQHEPLARFFDGYLYHNVQGRVRPEGVAQLAPAMGKTVAEGSGRGLPTLLRSLLCMFRQEAQYLVCRVPRATKRITRSGPDPVP